MENLLAELLECGTLDIQILDDVGYDLGEIVYSLRNEGLKPTLNLITQSIFYKGQSELTEYLKELIQDTKEFIELCSNNIDEKEKLETQLIELKTLNPEEDIDWFCNCLDTSIWFSENEEIYRKYLSKQIQEIEDNMGFCF